MISAVFGGVCINNVLMRLNTPYEPPKRIHNKTNEEYGEKISVTWIFERLDPYFLIRMRSIYI